MIKEVDGFCQVFSVFWLMVLVFQCEGYICFVFIVGEYCSGNSQQEMFDFFQGMVMYGLLVGWMFYGGIQLVDCYCVFNFGVGKNMGYFGVLLLDIIQVNVILVDDSEYQGQLVCFFYNKFLDEIGINLQLVGYCYFICGYYNFVDIIYCWMSGYSVEIQDGVIQVKLKFIDYYNLVYSKCGKVQLSVIQQLGCIVIFYFSGSYQIYWGIDDVDEQLQVGFNVVVDDINWLLSYSLIKNVWQQGCD